MLKQGGRLVRQHGLHDVLGALVLRLALCLHERASFPANSWTLMSRAVEKDLAG